MLTRKFWEGREIFVVVGGATMWPSADNPLARMAPHAEQGPGQLRLHIIATADIRNWSFQHAACHVTKSNRRLLLADGEYPARRIRRFR